MNQPFIFELGASVKDKLTGYTGVVMSRVEYISGCNTYGVAKTKLNKEGKMDSWEYFDEDRLTLDKNQMNIKNIR